MTESFLQVVEQKAAKSLYLCPPLSLLNNLSHNRKEKLLITKLFEEDIDPTTDYFF